MKPDCLANSVCELAIFNFSLILIYLNAEASSST